MRGGVWLTVALFATGVARAQTNGRDPLAMPVSVHLAAATLDDALRTIAKKSGANIGFSSDLLPPSVRVTLDRNDATVGEVLRQTLAGTGLGFTVLGSGHVIILRTPLVRPPRPATGLPTSVINAATAPALLDRMIVMGTPVAGGAERALATTVGVITSDAIERRPTAPMAQLVASTAPGVTLWDVGASGPVAQIAAIRGASSFTANYLKTYLDGVELASPYLFLAIDPAIVERVEVIAGPQGSAMYGADAISGVAQVMTRKGAIASGGPRADAAVWGGRVESAFASANVMTQRFAAGAEGGGPFASLRVAGVWGNGGAFVENGHQTSGTAVAAGRAIVGPLLLDGTLRATQLDYATPISPALKRALGNRAAPAIAAAEGGEAVRVGTIGLTATHEPRDGWRNTLVVGYDRNTGALVTQRNPASVADFLLGVNAEDARRASLRLASSLRMRLGDGPTQTVTMGLEHSSLRRARSERARATSAARGATLYADSVRNTGAFSEWKLDWGQRLYLTGGLRAEWNSSFGAGYGTAWSPMVGAAYVMGAPANATVKLRSAWGKGIRPPPPSARRALATNRFRQIENPDLAPETQSGGEVGADIAWGSRASVSFTAYDQIADGLVQHVLPDPRNQPNVLQQQNVGRIGNRGFEAHASAHVGAVTADMVAGHVSSQVRALSRFYTGDLRVGDPMPEVPTSNGSASLTMVVRGVSATAGATYVGAWTGYDWLRYYVALAGGEEKESSMRAYWIRYPSATRPFAMIGGHAGAWGDWFARVDNLTNRQHDTRDNLTIGAGRTTAIGLRIGGR